MNDQHDFKTTLMGLGAGGGLIYAGTQLMPIIWPAGFTLCLVGAALVALGYWTNQPRK